MKKIAQVVIGMLMLSTSALARYNGPIVVKNSGGGFTPPEWSQFEKCEVYSNKVVVTHSFAAGELVSKEEHPISFSGTSNLLAIAAKAELENLNSSENGLCDAPESDIYTVKIMPNDSVSKVVLFTSGGCGSPRLERSGAYASILRNIVETYCPKTFDAGQH